MFVRKSRANVQVLGLLKLARFRLEQPRTPVVAIDGENMNADLEEGGGMRQRWFLFLRLWARELKLRFDLFHCRDFKRLCEQSDCPNLTSLEEEQIQKLQSDIACIQKRRAEYFSW